MILLDANILLYAYVDELPQHRQVAQWLEALLKESNETVAIAWVIAAAFLRITTNKGIFGRPWTIPEAAERVNELLRHPMVRVIGPSENHWSFYLKTLSQVKGSGDIVMDAHIAAIALENGASVATADKDFRRFSDYLKIIDPLKA